jgi:hypothetical protein
MDELPGKLATNYLPVDLTDRPSETQEYCAAFPTLSRANHSCGPNAKCAMLRWPVSRHMHTLAATC